MHEYSIVSALMEQCQQLAAEHGAKGIARVAIKIGAMSGVEPELVRTAFNTFREHSVCHQAVLDIDIAPLTLACNQCRLQSTPEERTVICPHCHSQDTRVIDGEDMLLMQLELITD
ncbi:hydrogenase maturation nickel metallochaperone HypA [Shewanella algae]|uniref:hydrogenase maturation nickel metallochaperone HypA n=1 Tax=Shewanella algae TaxID=38313 RepID=UPI001AAD765A|nr:hydrogenase maturation nickel metallochaperone HypA [Shewanella algae]MBO2603653.1 hydrogenase maturation nickel metallochaperone HypA [Shewanella algae]